MRSRLLHAEEPTCGAAHGRWAFTRTVASGEFNVGTMVTLVAPTGMYAVYRCTWCFVVGTSLLYPMLWAKAGTMSPWGGRTPAEEACGAGYRVSTRVGL